MIRRAFIALLGNAALMLPLAARGERRVARIGFLSPSSAEEWDKSLTQAFEAGLNELGYVSGKTIEIEYRYTNGKEERIEELARQLVELNVDVIVSTGTGVYAAAQVTKTVPIVAAVSGDLVTNGLADSPGRPGRNVTGQTYFLPEMIVKRIAMLKQIKPTIKSVGLLVPQDYPAWPAFFRSIDAQINALGVELKPIEVADPSACDDALSAYPGASVHGLVVFDSPRFAFGRGPAAISAAALRHGLPAAAGVTGGRKGDYLLGYGADLVPMFSRAATFVAKILNGVRPGEIPIEQATRFVTIVNLKTAGALGLEIPQDLLASADEVIE